MNNAFYNSVVTQAQELLTLRIPGVESPQTRVSVYACNEFQPPPPQNPVCRNQSETCNGEDDNCNGAIDEGAVCETRCTTP